MRIKAFQIKNYKSYFETPRIEMADGMNIVTGQNNAGKTALLQALEFRFEYRDHISERSLPAVGEMFHAACEVELLISVTGEELRSLTEHLPEVRFNIPPDQQLPIRLGIANESGYGHLDPRILEQVWGWVHQRPEIEFRIRRIVRQNSNPSLSYDRPSHTMFSLGTLGSPVALIRKRSANGHTEYSHSYIENTDLVDSIAGQLSARIYRFSAERFSLGESPFGASDQLAPDARNLAEVLNTLQPNVAKYSEYVSLVRDVLPQVKWVSVVPLGTGKLRTDIWSTGIETKRSDLAIPLNESGTGLGQVLAIIYVAYTSKEPRVFLIDEPQSFLHPGAARKLIEVLKIFPQHQYIISTHSAAIISAAEPREILVLKNEGNETQIKVADASDNDLLAELLKETGTRLSDVFGMERVVWAEGPTEAAIFPKILADLGKMRTSTAVVPIRNTGDLETKDAQRIFEIYNNLSSKASLLPQSVYFLLDRELRSPQDLALLKKSSGGRAYFVPRRNIECFFLYPDAIAAVCSNIEGFAEDGQPIREQIVRDWLESALINPKYWPTGHTPTNDPAKLDEIDGADVLADLFNSLSETRVSYRKTLHSVQLFNWIYEFHRDRLSELVSFLNSAVE